ncbi:MAG: 3-isopropylmalate dehydratase large subunit [Deltaproteobacteria bacterium]|nr:3-isopropylmalate dehydratase large subunit [Deltaproteobacteria bacterium]MBN2674164.1 3-isopropylmalate dehydratase large subunit [Deltaproteobacteria bacterium]
MGKNLYAKVFDRHAVEQLPSGQYQLLIGLHMVHEVTSPQAFAMIREAQLGVPFPNRTFATVDHIIPTTKNERVRPLADTMAEEMLVHIEKNTSDYGIRFFSPEKGEQGVVHVVGPEQGITQPGMTIACGDSHTSTHGAFGALAFGIGTSQVADVLSTQTLAMSRLKVRQIRFTGQLKPGVYAKDVALAYIHKLGVNGGVGYAYEFAGEVIEGMSMEERMTVCNMSIEGGARCGYVNPDETTFAFLKDLAYAPKGDAWERAIADWRSIASDADAEYDDVVEIPGEEIEPFVTWGITPAQSVGVGDTLPSPAQFSGSEQQVVTEAYEYMDFQPGQQIAGVPVNVCFIGSCTNGRVSDFEIAAEIIKGKKVADGIRALAVPGSMKVKNALEARGIDKIFVEAGFEWREAGCSMCLAMNPDKLKGREICASTSNRNFKGRQGSPAGRTLLMSPAMVAAAALTGKVSDVREVIK